MFPVFLSIPPYSANKQNVLLLLYFKDKSSRMDSVCIFIYKLEISSNNREFIL